MFTTSLPSPWKQEGVRVSAATSRNIICSIISFPFKRACLILLMSMMMALVVTSPVVISAVQDAGASKLGI